MKFSAFIFVVLFSIINNAPVYSQASEGVEAYNVVDKLPQLKGAGNDLSKYIKKQIDYTEAYKLRGVEGDIWVSFIVTAEGKVTEVEVEKGIDEELDQEVVNVILSGKKWKPGKIGRKNVNTQMRIPVRFSLTNSERLLAEKLESIYESGKRPLFVLDNKIIDGLVKIEDYNVESIRIIKGEKAVTMYGARAESGVVIITSKRGTPPLY